MSVKTLFHRPAFLEPGKKLAATLPDCGGFTIDGGLHTVEEAGELLLYVKLDAGFSVRQRDARGAYRLELAAPAGVWIRLDVQELGSCAAGAALSRKPSDLAHSIVAQGEPEAPAGWVRKEGW